MDEVRDRNVYILGAGFSAPAGVRVIHDFIDRSRIYFDDPSSNLDTAEREHFRRFLDFKQKMAQAREKVKIDLDNIEELFGLVEISQRLGRAKAETRASTVYVIAKTLELATRSQRVEQIDFRVDQEILKKRGGETPTGYSYTPRGSSEGDFAADMYVHFASLAIGLLDDPARQASRANTFITFNYDLLLDDALRRVGVCTGLSLAQKAFASRSRGIPFLNLLRAQATRFDELGNLRKLFGSRCRNDRKSNRIVRGVSVAGVPELPSSSVSANVNSALVGQKRVSGHNETNMGEGSRRTEASL